MKLTEKQKEQIKEVWGDWEVVHGLADDFALKRLTELDKEFTDDLEKNLKGAKFWYA